MKVKLPKDYRARFTLEDMDIARKLIRDLKEDDATPTWYAEIAVDHWLRNTSTCRDAVLTATAEIAKNGRAWDAFGEGTGHMDVWIESVTKTWGGYLELGAYLTDIWSIGGDADFTEHMYAQYFTRSEDV